MNYHTRITKDLSTLPDWLREGVLNSLNLNLLFKNAEKSREGVTLAQLLDRAGAALSDEVKMLRAQLSALAEKLAAVCPEALP